MRQTQICYIYSNEFIELGHACNRICAQLITTVLINIDCVLELFFIMYKFFHLLWWKVFFSKNIESLHFENIRISRCSWISLQVRGVFVYWWTQVKSSKNSENVQWKNLQKAKIFFIVIILFSEIRWIGPDSGGALLVWPSALSGSDIWAYLSDLWGLIIFKTYRSYLDEFFKKCDRVSINFGQYLKLKDIDSAAAKYLCMTLKLKTLASDQHYFQHWILHKLNSFFAVTQ